MFLRKGDGIGALFESRSKMKRLRLERSPFIASDALSKRGKRQSLSFGRASIFSLVSDATTSREAHRASHLDEDSKHDQATTGGCRPSKGCVSVPLLCLARSVRAEP
jgi:hypothetical protein